MCAQMPAQIDGVVDNEFLQVLICELVLPQRRTQMSDHLFIDPDRPRGSRC